MNAIEAHFEKNYYATIRPVKHLTGITVDFPKNLLMNIDESKFIYEVENDRIIIYCDGVVVDKVKCPRYAARLLVNTDVSIRLTNRHLPPEIVLTLDVDGNKVDVDDSLIYTIVQKPELEEDVDKERRLIEAIFSGGKIPVTEDIIEGFSVIGRYYLRETNDE